MSDAYEHVEVTSVAELRQWLEVEHDRRDGAWLVTWKKNTPDKYVSYEELVRELLCVGWIDSQARRLDENRSQLMITPRRPGSAWSQPNKVRVAELEAAGLMRPAGLAAVALAQQTGTWTALDDVDNLVEPAALTEALNANPAARQHWEEFPRSARRAILQWISQAKREPTRATRIAETARLAADNIRANQPPRRD